MQSWGCCAMQKGVGAGTAGEGAAAPLASLLRTDPVSAVWTPAPQAQSAPASWGEGVFKPMVHLAGLRAAPVGPETHTHTHIPPRNVGYICMHMYREHAKCNRTQTHAHMKNTAQTSTHPCRHAPGSMHTHTPGITWHLHAHKIVPTTQEAPFLCRDTDTGTRILG